MNENCRLMSCDEAGSRSETARDLLIIGAHNLLYILRICSTHTCHVADCTAKSTLHDPSQLMNRAWAFQALHQAPCWH